MTVVQVIRGWGRSYMVPSHNSKVTPEENRRRENFLAQLRDFVALNKTDRGALVVTYHAIEKHFANIPGVAVGHFNNLRGIDAHRYVGALFVIGRPLPDFRELRTRAMALTGRPVPIEKPHKETRRLVMVAGSSRSIEVRAYDDPTLEMLRAAITDAEVIDNVGRARAVNRTSPDEGVHVYLMTDVVTPLPVTTLTNWNNLRLRPVARMAARGCVLQCSVDAHKAYPDLFDTANAAKTAIRVEKARWGSSPYEKLIIRETTPPLQLTPIRYQLAGPGKGRPAAWFAPDMVANSRSWLEQKLGPLTLWQPPAAQPQHTPPVPHDDEVEKLAAALREALGRPQPSTPLAACHLDITLTPRPAPLRLLFTGFRPIIEANTPADQALLDERAAIQASIIAKRGMTDHQGLDPAAVYPAAGANGHRQFQPISSPSIQIAGPSLSTTMAGPYSGHSTALAGWLSPVARRNPLSSSRASHRPWKASSQRQPDDTHRGLREPQHPEQANAA